MKKGTVFVCQNCGFHSPKWLGRCSQCGEWNTMVEELEEEFAREVLESGGEPVLYQDIKETTNQRIPVGIDQFNNVLGGGLVLGSVVLIGGEPGIGKSTLLLQVSRDLASEEGPVLYVSGEESLEQIKLRGDRLGLNREKVYLLAETALEKILNAADRMKPRALVIDSVQTIFSSQLTSSPGTISQVREVTNRVFRLAKRNQIPVFLIGHITKEGSLAGPKSLEHMVDVVLLFEGERDHHHRVLRVLKNRFGPVSELAIFEMGQSGLKPIDNPSAFFLRERPQNEPGSVVISTIKGSRPLLVEIQALVSSTLFSGNPRRMSIGLDHYRVSMLLALVEKKIGYSFAGEDIYLNVAGGLEVDEPAADLGVVLSVISSIKNIPLPREMAVFGEVGLSGEVRSVSQPLARVKEARSLGFETVLMPAGNLSQLQGENLKGIRCLGVDSVRRALAQVF
ncbi:MAG: DNA repair protein RadA [Candidatus Saccharicenans subterraneus]|uniref:DNA repair protein RadA n=1 Tax=Candidatus Saccharicenans subterraneus TaxID=2508984 RepID=A0A3E2BQ85_9BACT|nr:MAG: DNA repair protein RadA [Candidatus Saccharicenans subterraneum]